MTANNAFNFDVPNTKIAPHNELQKEGQSDDEDFAAANLKPIKMVRWRGNLVSEKEAKALCHVFDNLQDHFGHQRPDPRIRVTTSLAHPGQGWSWNGDLDFSYDINGDQCNLAYVSMDVCVDLTPKLVHKHGQAMLNDYGSSWVYVYVPESTFDKFKCYVKAGTGWDVSDEGNVYDPNRNLVAIEAEIHHKSGQPKPSFWMLKDNDASGNETSFSRIGSIQEVSAQPHQQRTHRGVGIFSVSMEVEGTPNFEPTPGEDKAKLSFTLVSVRTWGITECVAPIVHAPASIK
mmetsp:Transcript_21989/g.34506  ORF Transcript_21989/g.34506 Transcript_21989/m.34506 type:complete len:289 (+) Transcript_21989:110-976(+)|eukprot:CAMPEP_0201719038 /NCGR_PEP_ID=MMETSP0593-20130828/4376_1 /ASSEMBLY_ACC=CAM_ASM_000672 /TAXON_ID=267983 /ORGANISM="Skeletonema japonicum, Strain CCMP2506" /LENGTH=288 /DNA_ID=CAMNT_0048209429 /DNA_START=98 /DNA_END=964 /DNA_ORIENTATION=+